MKKQMQKLSLHRETVRNLDALELLQAGGAVLRQNPSYNSGDSWCWCSNPCNVPTTQQTA